MMHKSMPPRLPARGGRGVTLKAKRGPLAKVIAISVLAAIWNAFTAFLAWPNFRRGDGLGHIGCELAFFALFALIGAMLIFGVFYQLLALRNPRPEMTLRPRRSRRARRRM
jgi:hypothetical protein